MLHLIYAGFNDAKVERSNISFFKKKKKRSENLM